MKLTVVLLTAVLLQVHASGVAQSVSISGKDISLKEVFAIVEKQTGYLVFGKNELLRSSRPVSLAVKDMPLLTFIETVLKDQPLSYRIDGRNIILSRRQPLERLITGEQSAPPVLVTGNVFTASGAALADVSIRVKGSRTGTTTNAQGAFALKDLPDNAVIQVSMVGYEPLEILIRHSAQGYTAVAADEKRAHFVKAAGGKEEVVLQLIMEQSNSELDAIQVIAYGATTERLNVGNVTTVRAADIEKQPVNNPLYALQGRVPGLLITPTTGLAGGEVKLQIRGYNSLSGNVEPLIVVDGLPIQNNVPGLGYGSLFFFSALSFLNPGDIESISVLKDADATSIYGSRGSGGVILVTTKKGQVGKTAVDVRVQNGWAEVPRKLELMNTEDYIRLRREAYNNSGVDFINTFPYNVPEYKYVIGYDLYVWDTTRYTDWQEELVGGRAQYLDAQASISGGTATFKYLLGGMYHRETTVFPGQDDANSRGNTHFSLSGTTPDQRFRATLTGSYMMERNRLPGVDFTGRSVKLPPNAPPIYLPNGELNWAPLPGGAQSWENPYSQLLDTYDATVNNILANAEISYQLFPFLTMKVQGGYNNLQGQSTKLSTIAAANPNDPNYSSITGRCDFTSSGARSVSLEPQIQVNAGLAGGTINVLVGGSIQNSTTSKQSVIATGFTSDALLKNLASAGDYWASNESSQYRYAAVFGRVSYNFRNKYILDIAGRRDGSSRFGPGNQFGNFGSVGAGWIFTEEPFMMPLSFLSFGKFRFSYGTSGNDAIGDYGYMEKYEAINAARPYQGARGYRTMGLFNEDYAWEVVKKMEFGLETGFFDDRIFVNASYFHNRSGNQLRGYPMPTFVGPGSSVVNLPALIQNTGLELLVKTTNIRTKDFSWQTTFNYTRNRNKLIKYPGIEKSSFSNSFKVGKPFTGFMLVFKFAGVDPETGRYQFYNKNGELVTDPQDNSDPDGGRYVEIYTDPKFYGGIGNTFNYRNWSLDVLFQYRKQTGKGVLSEYAYFVAGFPQNFPVQFLDRWRKPGDRALIQKAIGNYDEEMIRSAEFAQASDFDIMDVSFLRLKNLSLSYSIPASLKERWKLGDVRLFLLGQNLLTFTSYTGLDPETMTTGTLPPLRTITAGMDIRF